jgi:hypothetical protein
MSGLPRYSPVDMSGLPRNSLVDISCICTTSVALRAWRVSTIHTGHRIANKICVILCFICSVWQIFLINTPWTKNKKANFSVKQKLELDSEWFCRWCITHRITGFLDFFPLSGILGNTTFRKLDLFPSSGEGGAEDTYSVGPLRKS